MSVGKYTQGILTKIEISNYNTSTSHRRINLSHTAHTMIKQSTNILTPFFFSSSFFFQSHFWGPRSGSSKGSLVDVRLVLDFDVDIFFTTLASAFPTVPVELNMSSVRENIIIQLIMIFMTIIDMESVFNTINLNFQQILKVSVPSTKEEI